VGSLRRYWGIVLTELMVLLIVAGVVMVGVDWLVPDTRLRGLGMLAFIGGLAILIVREIHACVGKAWGAGGRARERQLRLEQSVPNELAVVHEMKR
jgi:hypothetical protein